MGVVRTLRFLWSHPLGRRRRLRSIARYFGWQTLGRLRGGRVLDPWVGTARLHVEHGMAGATGNLYVGLHEFHEMAFLLHLLRPGDLFVDVGANVGSYTILASSVVGCDVVAFEPAPAAWEALARNVRLNRAESRVRIHRAAVSDRGGHLPFTTGDDTMNRVASGADLGRADLQPVAAVTLDEALASRPPTLVKIDVEGHEREVLQGMPRALAAPGLLALLVEAWQEGGARGEGPVAVALKGAGFEPATYEPWTRSLGGPVPEGTGPAGGPATGNQLWIRRREEVARRLRTAPKVRVLGFDL